MPNRNLQYLILAFYCVSIKQFILRKVEINKDWRYFDSVIEKAKTACNNSEMSDNDHFVVDNKMVKIGSGAKRAQKDYKLTRYACYLIAQNANPRLKVIALAQT